MIIVMDEIFNSTNPVEGIAGAYAILKKNIQTLFNY
jgi:DNA mismatch repair ATPase MutS